MGNLRPVSGLSRDIQDDVASCLLAYRWGAGGGSAHEHHAFLAAAHGIVLPAAAVVLRDGVYRCSRYLLLSDCGAEHERHLRCVNAGVAVLWIHRALGSGHLSAHDAARRLRLLAPWGPA